MDTIKAEIKKEYPDDEGSSEFFHEVFIMNSDDVLLDNGCDAEIKSETTSPDFNSQNDIADNLELKKYNTDYEIEIKEEPLWLETESLSVCDDIKDGDLSPVKLSRLCMEAVSDDNSDKSLSFYNGRDHLEQEHLISDNTEMSTAGEHVLSQQPGKCDIGERCTRPSYLKLKDLIHEYKKAYQHSTSDKSISNFSNLKTNNLVHEGKNLHQCEICDKTFTQLSNLKRHNLIHEGKKPYQCKICDQKFTRLLSLKGHNLVHEGKKPHQCKICDKRFTHLSNLKSHNLIHEGKKPYQCKICDKRFTQLSNLKRHNFIHEGKKPY